MQHEFFGQKKKFGIEIEIHNLENNVGKARLWVEGKAFGEFNIKHKLTYLVPGLKKMVSEGEKLWDESFNELSEIDIFKRYVTVVQEVMNMSSENYGGFEFFKKFTFFFGDQFDTVNHIIYVKNEKFHFLWSVNNDYSGKKVDYMKGLEIATVSVEVLEEVATRFLQWWEETYNL